MCEIACAIGARQIGFRAAATQVRAITTECKELQRNFSVVLRALCGESSSWTYIESFLLRIS